MEPIDNTVLIDSAIRVIGIGSDLIEKLERDVVVDSPEKERTLWAIKFVIETQSDAIRRLVEQQLEICDKLNEIIENHQLS